MTAVAIFVVGWFVIQAIDEHRKAQTSAAAAAHRDQYARDDS